MAYRKGIAVLAAAVALAVPGVAQTPAELLQKGIYAQETAGDLDSALQTFRQITASAGSQSPEAAQAQYRIAEIMLQKGDMNGAVTEFGILASRYSEQSSLIAKIARRLKSVPMKAGVVKDGLYRNTRSEVTIPLGNTWKVAFDGPSQTSSGDLLDLTDGSPWGYGAWMKPETSTSTEIADKLQASVPNKIKQNANIQGFAVRPETIVYRTINGRRAVSAVFDEMPQGDTKMVHLYTWVYTAKTHVAFWTNGVPAADLLAAQAKFDQLVQSAIVP